MHHFFTNKAIRLVAVVLPLLLALYSRGQACNQNYSLRFDGATAYMRVPGNNQLHLTNSLTIEVWVKPNSYNPNGNSYIYSRGGGVCGPEGNYSLRITPTGYAEFTYSENASYAAVLRSATTIPLNTWTHITIDYNYQTHIGNLYINGSMNANNWINPPITYSYNFVAGADLIIGAQADPSVSCPTSPPAGYAGFFNGQVDGLRIGGYSLASLYPQNYAYRRFYNLSPNLADYGLLVDYRFDATGTNPVNTVPASPINNAVLSGNYTWVTNDAAPVDVFNANCRGYCGSGYAGDVTTLDGVTGLTVSAWVYITAFPSSGSISTIISKGSDYTTPANHTFGMWIDAAGTLHTSVSNGSTRQTAQVANIATNRWVHVALSWATGFNTSIYIDGTWTAVSPSTLGGVLGSNAANLTMRTSFVSNEGSFNGYIDEVSVFITQVQGNDIMAWKDQVITAAHPNHANLVHYYRFNDEALYQPDFGCGKTTLSTVSFGSQQVSYLPCGGPDTIGPVINLQASNNDMEKVTLTWSNPTGFLGGANSVLGGTVFYDVFRDGSPIGTVLSAVSVNTFVDNNATCQHTYSVRPFWRRQSDNAITMQGAVATANGRTADINFRATNGVYPNKTVLTWNNMSAIATGGIELRRNGTQLAVLSSPNITTYTDFDGTPGVRYTYEIILSAPGKNYKVCPDTGWVKENGRLSGYVRSPLNAPIPNVVVTATGTVLGQTYTYTDTTDVSGFYEIRDVYYDQQATYTITPSKGTHSFNPSSIDRTLDLLAYNAPQANFTDTSVFTIAGAVYFPNQLNGTGCPATGVQILVNGQDAGLLTDALGNFTFTALNEGTYTFTPRYPNHAFNPPSAAINVTDDVSGVNFMDTRTDSLWLDLKGYCNTQICNNATFRISGTGPTGCYATNITVPGNTINGYAVVLPAQLYSVELLSVNTGDPGTETAIINAFQSLGNKVRTVDLRNRDSVEANTINTQVTIVSDTLTLGNGQVVITTDTLVTSDTVTTVLTPAARSEYIYGGKLSIELLGISPECNNSIVLSQGNVYNMRIRVLRNYNFTGNQTCPVNTAQLTIFDDISDSSFLHFTLDTFFLDYAIKPGLANVIGTGPNPYQKFISIYAETWDAEEADTSLWAVVIGTKALTPTFVTKTPQLPMIVLHDPPGDGSSATLTNGSSLTYDYGFSYEDSRTTEGFVNMRIGQELPVPFTGIVFRVGSSSTIKASTVRNDTGGETSTTTWTMEDNFSTSSDEEFVGEDADLVMGASFNMIYGLSYLVTHDSATCTTGLDTAFTWGATDFATTYSYTIGHIKNTIIPQLTQLVNYFQSINSDSALIYQDYKNVWQQVVDENHNNIANGSFKENRSFSAGADYTYTEATEVSASSSIGFIGSFETSLATELGIGTDINGLAAGLEVKLNWLKTYNQTTAGTNTNVVSYTLSDSDPGDFFSVDVLEDRSYGVPAFRVVAGTSSCPHEEGTQQRDLPAIQVLNPNLQNVPLNAPATFTVQMSNLSESQETRTYEVIVDPNSNLDGAVVRLAGQVITQAPATFTIPANSSVLATLSVEAGPIAVDYNQLKLVIYSPCDPDISAEAVFNVGFQSECSDVTLFTPSNNWLINDVSDTLRITYGGFNVNDTSLLQIGLELRRPGQGWSSVAAATVSRTQLQQNNQPYYVVDINMGGLPDGPYEIRAYADCASSGTRSYSGVLSGTIDRTSVTLLGTPSPADGVLNINEEVSVTFSEDIDCGHFFNLQTLVPYTVTLVRAHNGTPVPFTYTCAGNKILFNINPDSLNALQNVLLTARVNGFYDVNGNLLQYPVSWSFVVNNSPVFWQPSGVNASVAVGSTSTLQGTLKNLSNQPQSFTLSSVPAWLSPVGVPAGIAQGATLAVNFNVSSTGLNPGIYTDTVYADFTSLGVQQPLYIHLTVYANSPVWTVVPQPAQMNIIANFSLNNGNAPLSADANDRIGVFYGNQCRGVANIQYTPAGNTYAAYITVYGNPAAQPQEVFEFRMWDASTATEYQAVETQAFIENAQLGQPLAPMILHPAGVVQRIPLAAGWNWVSTYLIPNNPAVNQVLKYTDRATGNIIKTNNSYAQFTGNSQAWYGTLSQIDWQKSYQIMVAAPTELQVIGQRLADTVTLPVVAGWNWIGYPQSLAGTVTDFMASFNKTNGDVLQSSTQFSTYASAAWNGSLQSMQPGQGYKLKAGSGGNVLVAPRAAPGWTPDVYANEFNMNVTAVVKANGTELMGNFIVGAFINGTCVGLSSPQYAGTLPRVFLTLHGNAADNNLNVEFLIYDYNTDSIYTPTYTPVTFTTDAQQGTIESAFVLNLEAPLAVRSVEKENYTLRQNVPNPFNGQTRISFVTPKAGDVTITVYDYTGKVIRVIANGPYQAGEHHVEFNQNELSSGMYFYQMKAGSFVETKKMIVKQ